MPILRPVSHPLRFVSYSDEQRKNFTPTPEKPHRLWDFEEDVGEERGSRMKKAGGLGLMGEAFYQGV
jgi:hypothetical protein